MRATETATLVARASRRSRSPWRPSAGLLPGGSFWMGAVKTDAVSVGDMPNSDPHVLEGWEQSYRVDHLAPFFMSKYEMTEGQWKYFVGRNRNLLRAIPSQPAFRWPAPNKPVNGVSFNECVEVLGRRLGLRVPSEEQWEYAARAGSKQAYWTGPDAASLEDHENIFEQTASNSRYVAAWYAEKERVVAADFDDWRKAARFAIPNPDPAPVGSYVPNALGLFDVAGDVTECCYPRRPDVPACILRGSNYQYGVAPARSAWRRDVPKGFSSHLVGVRPARAIQE